MPPRPYKDITKALTVLAFWRGNYNQATKVLQSEEGMRLVPDTLKGWATGKYSEDYEQIKENFRQTFQEEVVSHMRELIKESSAGEKLAIQRAIDTMYGTDDPKAAAQAAYYLSQVKKTNVEKLQTMTGQPTHIIEDRTPEAALRSLVQRGILKPVGDLPEKPSLKIVEEG